MHGESSANNTTEGDNSENTLSFEEVIAYVAQGKEVPGIKQIPKVTLGMDKASTSQAEVRKKPWE